MAHLRSSRRLCRFCLVSLPCLLLRRPGDGAAAALFSTALFGAGERDLYAAFFELCSLRAMLPVAAALEAYLSRTPVKTSELRLK
jgi:hypothetical protein